MMGVILKGLTTIKYKLYGVSKAYKIVLRRKPTRSVVPFYKIYLNLIPRIIVYNGHEYTVHFFDNIIRINEVEMMAKKLSLTKIVIKYCNIIEQ